MRNFNFSLARVAERASRALFRVATFPVRAVGRSYHKIQHLVLLGVAEALYFVWALRSLAIIVGGMIFLGLLIRNNFSNSIFIPYLLVCFGLVAYALFEGFTNSGGESAANHNLTYEFFKKGVTGGLGQFAFNACVAIIGFVGFSELAKSDQIKDILPKIATFTNKPASWSNKSTQLASDVSENRDTSSNVGSELGEGSTPTANPQVEPGIVNRTNVKEPPQWRKKILQGDTASWRGSVVTNYNYLFTFELDVFPQVAESDYVEAEIRFPSNGTVQRATGKLIDNQIILTAVRQVVAVNSYLCDYRFTVAHSGTLRGIFENCRGAYLTGKIEAAYVQS